MKCYRSKTRCYNKAICHGAAWKRCWLTTGKRMISTKFEKSKIGIVPCMQKAIDNNKTLFSWGFGWCRIPNTEEEPLEGYSNIYATYAMNPDCGWPGVFRPWNC